MQNKPDIIYGDVEIDDDEFDEANTITVYENKKKIQNKKFGDYLAEYTKEPSSILYKVDNENLDCDGLVPIESGLSGKRANLMGQSCDWAFFGSKEAKKVLSRKQFRRLDNRIMKRIMSLARKYNMET